MKVMKCSFLSFFSETHVSAVMFCPGKERSGIFVVMILMTMIMMMIIMRIIIIIITIIIITTTF